MNTLGAQQHFLKMSERFIWNQMATSYISESLSHTQSEQRGKECRGQSELPFPLFPYLVILEEQLS